jgi:HAD superfamily hydrolase (TIGR01450 family)
VSASSGTLLERHDALLVDLDGVVHVGDAPVPHAADSLQAARDAGLRVRFVTNNASRAAADVASRLSAFGVTAAPDEVLTSSMAAADLLASRLPRGSRVLVVGGDGLRQPLQDVGLQPVASADDDPAAVAQGWSPDLTWALLAEGAVAIRRGALWVATNTDATLPSARGPLPGNGAMVAAVRLATARDPEVVGKPAPTLFRSAAERAGARAPLVVGDRLDTDIAGAVAAGLPSLLVLTGVSTLHDVLAARECERPTYVARDLTALTTVIAPVLAADASDGCDAVRACIRAAWDGSLAASSYDQALQDLGLD